MSPAPTVTLHFDPVMGSAAHPWIATIRLVDGSIYDIVALATPEKALLLAARRIQAMRRDGELPGQRAEGVA